MTLVFKAIAYIKGLLNCIISIRTLYQFHNMFTNLPLNLLLLFWVHCFVYQFFNLCNKIGFSYHAQSISIKCKIKDILNDWIIYVIQFVFSEAKYYLLKDMSSMLFSCQEENIIYNGFFEKFFFLLKVNHFNHALH
jgi:hypothetical protein